MQVNGRQRMCNQRRIRFTIAVAIILGIMLSGLIVEIVNAAPSNPDDITVHTCRVFQNIYEDDDALFVISYDLDYASEPDEPADETFMMAIYDTDGTTLLYSRPLNYYQYNVHSIYLDDDEEDNITWGSEYVVRVMGNPIYFSPVEGTTMDSMVLSASTHWLTGTTSESRALLQYHCTDLASTLEDVWSTTLLITTPEGQVLNALGRTVFLDAIPGLSDVLTTFFQVSFSSLTHDEDEYDGSYEDTTTVSSRLGTQINNAFTNLGTTLGITSQWIAFLWIAFFAVTIAAIVYLGTGNTTAALMLTIPVMIYGGYVGAIPLALLLVLVLLIVVYMGYHIWLKGL